MNGRKFVYYYGRCDRCNMSFDTGLSFEIMAELLDVIVVRCWCGKSVRVPTEGHSNKPDYLEQK